MALASLAPSAWAGKDDLDLVSRGSDGSDANAHSSVPAISSDGRVVVFESIATNLHPDDTDTTRDLFARDPQTGATTLVTRATGATGLKADNASRAAAVSANGRFVAFSSNASNLDPDDSDSGPDVFVRDLQTNTTTLVSRATNGDKGDAFSGVPTISADGRFVAFESGATNLDPEDGDTIADVFVRDLQASTTTLVSRADGPTGTVPDGDSYEAAISADGRFVAFTSVAANLDPGDPDTNHDVYVRDLQTNTTTLVSRATNGDKSNSFSFSPAVSADGRVVAFVSDASNLHPDDGDGFADVFVRDLQTHTTTLASRATGAAGVKANENSQEPAISAHGRHVAFSSNAENLDPDDSDFASDVFIRDLQTNTTALVSRATGAAGIKGNDLSAGAVISGDGRFVAFDSSASNLHSDDPDPKLDVFRRDMHGAPPPPPVPPGPEPLPPAPTAPVTTAPARCVVPNVKRKTIRRARRLLVARNCGLGKVRRAYSARVPRGRVIAQSRRPGRALAGGMRVDLRVSRGRR